MYYWYKAHQPCEEGSDDDIEKQNEHIVVEISAGRRMAKAVVCVYPLR